MRTFVALPPLQKMTGGMAVLLRMAEHVQAAGFDVCLVPREEGAFSYAGSVPVLAWGEAKPGPQDVWLCPEGWPTLLLPGLHNRARTTIYVQNWAYLLGSLPEAVSFARLPVHFLAVSHPVAWHAREYTGKESTIVRPGIDLARFHAPHRTEFVDQTVRIAWMPRKNKALAMQIQEMLAARLLRDRSLPAVEWISIHRMTQAEVAETLRTCHIFLVTGFPEGCPLPPLEAMASGCLVVGFTGFGGWDYMRQALPDGLCPWFPARASAETSWGGNGFYCADADTVAAAFALEHALKVLQQGGEELVAVRASAAETAQDYSMEKQQEAVTALWARAAKGIALEPFID